MLQIGGDEDRIIGGSTPDMDISYDDLTTSFEAEMLELPKSEMITSFSETKKLTKKFSRDLDIDVTSTVIMTEMIEAVNTSLGDDVPPLIQLSDNHHIVERVNEVVTTTYHMSAYQETVVAELNTSVSSLNSSHEFTSYESEEKYEENNEGMQKLDIEGSVTHVLNGLGGVIETIEVEIKEKHGGMGNMQPGPRARVNGEDVTDSAIGVEDERRNTDKLQLTSLELNNLEFAQPPVKAEAEKAISVVIEQLASKQNVFGETQNSEKAEEPADEESINDVENQNQFHISDLIKTKQELAQNSSKDVASVRTFDSVSKSMSSFASSFDELNMGANSSSDEVIDIPPPDYDEQDDVVAQKIDQRVTQNIVEQLPKVVGEKKKSRRTSFRDIFIRPLRNKKTSKGAIPEFAHDFEEAPAATSTLTKLKKGSQPPDPIKRPSSKMNSLKRITSLTRVREPQTQLCASWFDRNRQKKARKLNGSSSDEGEADNGADVIICTCDDVTKGKKKCPSCSSNYIEIPKSFREISPDDVEKQQTLEKVAPLKSEKQQAKKSEKVERTDSRSRQRSKEMILPAVLHQVPSLGDLVVQYCKENPQVFTLNNLSSVRRREDLGPYGVEDMINIDDLNEASLLWNLRVRYDKELIYTYIGSILIAVNPYRMSDVYGLEMVKKYEGQVLGTMPPHLFAIGSAAYTRLTGPEPENQVVVISGESGAGKTESTKLVMQYLAAVNKSHSNIITEQILEAAPLLESFGNAKTVRNDNSSRFGKYLQVYFKAGIITGAKITEYLLEKSRIVTHASEERNYHVFYELLKGLKLEEKEKYGLTSADKYFYLNQGGSTIIPTKDDSEDFQSLLSAMQVLGFTQDEQDTIFRILSAVLHIGNVYFIRKPLKHGQEGVDVGSDTEIKWAAHLLQLSVDGIMRALTTKTTEARNERMLTPLNIDQALDARDAVAKALYSSLFSWLVNRVNTIVSKGPKPLAISILDIFGFEDFKENSFEQLCINYANESLQTYFNRHIFRLEQQEYIKEKIEWQTINFTDNLPVINLICKKPVGILHLLDDESNFPKATDQSFLEKAHYNHALNENYCRPRLNSAEFGIKHYAGLVWYSVDGFLDKNRDTLRTDVMDLLISSKISMVSRMFQELKHNNETSKSANRSDGRFITMKPRTPTVAARFHDSLATLLDSMSKSNPWFVRCLKPNNDKTPMKFDMPVVLEQLRYSGMLETIRIRKTGYPTRMRYSQFAETFRCLVPVRIPKGAPSKEICRVVLDRDPMNRENYQLGSTKVFMREPLQQKLEKERMILQDAAAVKIQTAVRGYLARRRYRLMVKSAIRIQSCVRSYLARRKYRRLRRGIVKAQAKLRGTRQRKLYLEMKEELKKRAEGERERSKVHKHQVEQQSKAMAGLSQLDVPSELAFMISKIDDWQPKQTERNVVKVVGHAPQREDYFELPPDIQEYSFQNFARANFKNHTLGMKQEPIETPFLPKSKELDFQDSLAIFKLILRFCADASLPPKKEVAIGNYVVNKGLINDKLRDEILCQLVNQSWDNPDETNRLKVWTILASCLSTFAPSPNLYKYLLKYVSDNGPDGFDVVCQQKLLQAARSAAPSGITRSYPPSILEWRSNRKKANMAIESKFYDGQGRLSGLESWATCEDVASLLADARGIDEDAGWTLMLSNGNEFYDLHGAEFALDVISELELPPAFPALKSSFLVSVRDENSSKGGVFHVERGLDESKKLGREKTRPEPPSRSSRTSLSAVSEENERKISVSSDQRGISNPNTGDLERVQHRSLSLDNLLNKEPAVPLKAQQFGLSRSRLNERYLSAEKLHAVAQQKQMEKHWNERNRKYSNEDFTAESSDSDLGMDDWDARLPSEELPRSRNRQDRTRTLDPDNRHSREMIVGDSDFDVDTSPVAQIKEYRTRHGHPRFVKSQQAFRKSKGERDYLRSSAHSDTSEAPSLASHVRRVRIPSQASDVDQFLDDLFLPVLDHNIDDLSDARSLATSIKGGKTEKRSTEALFDDILDSVTLTPQLASLTDSNYLAVAIKGGGRGEGRRKRDSENPYSQPPPPVGVLSPPQMVLPNLPMPMYAAPAPTDLDREPRTPTSPRNYPMSPYSEGMFAFPGMTTPYGAFTPDFMNQTPQPTHMPYFAPYLGGDSRVNTPGTPLSPVAPYPLMMPGYPFSPSAMSGMMTPNTAFDTSTLSAIQQNMQRLFLQSAVAQNMQIQQQLIAQNQALQQLLQQSAAAPFPTTPEPQFPADDAWTSPRRSGSTRDSSASSDRRSRDHIPPPVLPKSRSVANLNSSTESSSQASRLIARVSEDRKRNESTNMTEQSLPAQSKGVPVAPPLAVSSRRTSEAEMMHAQPAKTGVPPPPPLPTEPLFAGDQPFKDPYGRAKTVRIGKWRWPPPKEDGEEDVSGPNFFEFKMQKQVQRKLATQQSKDDSQDGEWGSFDMGGQDEATSRSRREIVEKHKAKNNDQDERQEETKAKPPGSIGKLKLSGELRTKLEMVHSQKTSRSSVQSDNGSKKDEPVEKSVRKLGDSRKLLLEQQLYGTRWQSVEEIEAITRTVVTTNEDEVDRSRRRPSAIVDPRKRSTSSPPSSYYSPSSTPNLDARKMSEVNIRKFSSQSQLIERTEKLEIDYKMELEAPEEMADAGDMEDDTLERVSKTKLHSPLQAPFFTYNMVPWTMHVRKEVFSPGESLVSPLAVHLVFAQIVQDTENTAILRMMKNDRMKMKQTLESFNIDSTNVHLSSHKMSLKRNMIELAKEFPLYFSRMYPVSGGRQSTDVQFLAVSHSGLRLVKRETTPEDRLVVLDTISFDDVIETSVPRASCLQIRLRSGGKLSLYSHRATLIRDMIERFAADSDASSQTFVRAVADYLTREPGVLGFKKGDLVRVANPADNYLEKGWLYGMLNGKAGVFPAEYVELVDEESLHTYEPKLTANHI